MPRDDFSFAVSYVCMCCSDCPDFSSNDDGGTCTNILFNSNYYLSNDYYDNNHYLCPRRP